MISTTRWVATAGLVATLAACAEREPEPEVQAGGAQDSTSDTRVTAGDLAVWDVRFDDESGDPGGFQMTEADGGWTFVTGAGGSGITWRTGDQLEGGPFVVSATMEERNAPADHAEGYGLFVGGRNLQDPDQRYTYFLVRGTGHYLIKRREGAETPTLADWTASEAVRKPVGAGGTASNTLEIRVQPDTTRFFVNATEVEALPTESAQPYGLAGLRVNHMLTVAVKDYRVGGETVRPSGAGAAAGGTYPTGAAPSAPDSGDAAR